ncbi:PREDICTED: uncharacterized protein LOC105131077 isoform X2 [Populus euphratica]|uniref:Uncharacterized protein LOC105131077 isoform X2 n=1 Tax=Populus euphratica TaxID=75702 RepID=A0AAJ6UMJ9_POPEU|nr:PREDICTED: uncharacterized protein LOC105131077 isoform X2 [Populus euphratica]XP_011032176.1 PREDICTED: uncharacterized protein LOC105131077 isoform X2 [Populus euphratica]XP_011032185.1 PREDICTED: uncharacterized protein LOC105131077 isoform X2 [Populus euphratica]
MEAPSELVGGTVQSLYISMINKALGQVVQPSTAQTKKAKRRWIKCTQRQFKKLKADYAESVKGEASSKEILDRLKNNLEQAREAKRLQEQIVEQQNLMINALLQLLPFEMTELGTGATGLPIHHPPEGPAIEESLGLLQSHLPQGLAHSGDLAIMESLGLLQSHVSQGLEHGNDVEQPALTYDGDLPVSLDHLNNPDPSRTAMASGSSPMQGSLAPQRQGNNNEQPVTANDDQFPDNTHQT